MAAISTMLALAAVTASVASGVASARQKPPITPPMPTVPDAPKPKDEGAEVEKQMSLLNATAPIAGSQTGRASTLLAPIVTDDKQRKTLLGR